MLNRSKLQFDNSYMQNPLIYGNYSLYQLGDINCEPGQKISLHRQKVMELTCVQSGKGSFVCDNKELKIQSGDLIFIRRGQMHEIVSSSANPLRYFYLGFEVKNEKELISFLQSAPVWRAKADMQIVEAFYSLFSEFIDKNAQSDMLIEAYLKQILYLSMRLIKNPRHRQYSLDTAKKAEQKLVYDVINYIDLNAGEIGSLGKLGEIFGYSYPYISKKFTQYYGGQLKDYFNRRRFEKANALLARGHTITQVAKCVGFGSIHAFSRAYKSYFGITPNKYKERNNVG